MDAGQRGLSAGVAEVQAPPLQFLGVVGRHVRELPEDVQVGGISCKNTQEEALVPIFLLCFATSHPRRSWGIRPFSLRARDSHLGVRDSSTCGRDGAQLFSLALPQGVLFCLSILCLIRTGVFMSFAHVNMLSGLFLHNQIWDNSSLLG